MKYLKNLAMAGVMGLILFGGGRAMAQTWYGTVSTSWNNPTNWTPSWLIPNNIQSVPGAGASIIVPAGCPFYPTITNNVSIGTLTLNQGSGSVTVAGGTLAVTSGGISILSGSSFTINSGASVTSSATVTAGGTWVVNGTLTAAVAMYNTVLFTINSGGVVNAATGGLNANDNGGYLYIYGTLNDGANTISDNANIIVSGGSVTAGNIILSAGGLTVTSGTLNAGAFTFFNGGNLTISGASTVTSSGAWTYDGGGYSLTGGNFTFSGAGVTLPGGTFASLNLSGAGTDVLASGTTISGNLSLAAGTKASVASGLNISAGSLTLAGAGQINGTWGSAASTAANKNSTWFAGTGLVTVTTNAALQSTATALSALTAATYGTSVTFTATVAPAPGGGTVQFSTNGVACGSPATVSGGTATLTTSALLPGSYTIAAAFNGTPTYSSSTSGTAAQVVNKAAVTITSGVTAGSKPYDGTTTATISSNNVVLSGVVAGDAAKVALATNGYTATFASSAAGSGLGVTVGGLTLTGSAAANYTLTQPTGLTAGITALPVTITSGILAGNKVYNGTATATISSNSVGLSGVLAADAANVKLSTNGYTAAFASSVAGTGLGVTVGGLTLTGSAAANYTLIQPAGLTANITAVPVTITSGLSANAKAYDGTTTATISSNNVVLSGVLAADVANVKLSTNGYTATFASAGTGTGVAVTVTGLTLTGSMAANYSLTQPAGLTANNTSIPVTIASGIAPNTKAYDGTAAATISSNNVVLSGVLAADAANVKLSTNGYSAVFATASAGTSVAVTVSGLTLTGSAAANYTLTQPAGLTANITVLPVSISSGLTGKNKAYDGTTTAAISVSGIVFSGVLAGDTAKVALSTNGYLATFASAAVGTGVGVAVSGLTLTGTAAANYVLTQPAGLTANITGVPVTIVSGLTANGKVYDGTTSATINLNNVVLGGVLTADAANVKLSTNGYTAAFTSATAGTSLGVTVSGLALTGSAAANYTLTQPAGLTASIATAPVAIAAGLAASNKVYNGTTTATISLSNAALSGVLAADTAKVSLATNGYSATFASASAGSGVVVTVSGLTLTGSAAANYTLTPPAGLMANITTAPVAIIAGVAALGKAYDGTITAAITVKDVVLSGVIAADAAKVSLATNGYLATFASAPAGTSLGVTVTGLSLAGSAAANYTLTQPAGLLANITAAPVTIASGLTVNNKAYDGTVAATISVSGVVLSGVVPADAANVVFATNGYTATFASAAPGLGLSVTVGGLTLTGGAAVNYKLAQPVGLTANITQSTLAVTSPTNGQTIVGNSSTVNVSGTTAGNIAVVAVWLNVNGGGWTTATSANGWTNWSAVLAASAGADTLAAYAVDTAGNHSVTNTLAFTIIHTSVLTLTTSGSGLVGPAYNGKSLEIGQGYTVVATPQYGWMFTNWTSNLLPASTPASLDFTMASNLVLTAHFVYTNYPVLAITAPTNGATWVTNAALLTVAGTTTGPVPRSTVWLSLNGGAWTNAVTTNQWQKWSSVLPMAAGSQVLSAYAVDTAGYHSLTNTVDFTLIHTSLMTVRTNGNGTVSTNFDTLHLEDGVNYTMQATGRHGWTFLDWTSNLLPVNNPVLTNNPYITFTMQSNLVLTANFVDLAPPTLTLNELAKGQTAVTNEAPLTISGTTTPAADASPITGVWVSFNSNAWQSATSANHWTNWTAVMTPTPGLQSVRAYAVDAVGNASLTNGFTFTCRQSFALVVRTNQTGAGLGTITPNYNGQQLIAGNTFSMKAQALPGNVFVSWTSNLLPGTNSPNYTFTMVSNLVVYANFHDTTPPTLTVTSPAKGQVVTTNSLTLQGTASDNDAVGQVWYAVNANPWQLATGTTNWTGNVALVPGTNVIQAYALDTANNSSITNTLSVLYAVAGTLTLQTNGLGTIAQPATTYYIGQNYTLTAVPAKGFAFTNWTGNPVAGTNQAAIKFTMVSNLALTATFVDTQNPTVTILSPASGNVTNSSIIVTGKAWDNWGLGAVYCQLNGGAWTLASPAATYTNWSLAVNLIPGTNVISACAADISGQEPYGTTRYSPTNSMTVVFQTAPASLNNLRAVVTPADGTTPFEVDFGSNVFSQYAWSTNIANDAGEYAYASPGQVTGVLQLQSPALPQNTEVQTWQLAFTNHYAAFISYTNAAGQPAIASAVFSGITNVAPVTLTSQTLVSVNALSAQTTYNFLTNGVVVATTGSQRQTNTWTLQNYGPCGALLVLANASQTNWSLFHFETALAAEYVSESSDGTADAGLAGFVRTTSGGNAPTAAALNGGVLLDNDGATLTSILLNNGAFALTTSDGSLTGTGTYDYTKLGSNEGQFILNYSGANAGSSATSVIQFYNPNFGVITNSDGASGLLLH